MSLVDVDDTAKAVYILSHLEKFKHVLELSDSVWANLPRTIREDMVCEGESLDSSSSHKLAIAIAQLPPGVRADMHKMIEEITQYVSTWQDGDQDVSLFGMLEDNDLAVVRETVAFVQLLGSHSTRALLHGLEAANNNEHCYILIQAKGKKSEVEQRRRISPEALSEFQIE